MNPEQRSGRILIPVALALGTAALYLPRLQDAPIYLVRDELFSGLAAHSVASTGRDPHGAFLPLYFQMDLLKHGSSMWFQPVLMYATTLALKALPFSEGTIRLPMAIAGVINVVLMYFVGRLLFRRELFAIAAAVLLALTPTHFMYSRFAMDFQAPLPFVLGWLLCVLAYLHRRDPRFLLAAGLLLGIGLYSYIAAVVLMPLYAVLTCVVLYVRREPVNRYSMLAAGFLLPVLLCVPFLLHHPTMVRDIAVHYQPDEVTQTTDVLGTVAALIAPDRVADAIARYGTFWNPRLLFIDGPLRFTETTWLVGVFLMPIAGLLMVGAARSLRHPTAPATVLLMGGLLSAPLPASFAGQDEAIRRALELIPFAVLIAVFGLETFWTARTNLARHVGFVALWAVMLALAVTSHDHVPHGQAFVRASTVPLAVAALAVVLDRFAFERLTVRAFAVPVILTLAAVQVAYFLGRASIVGVTLAGTFAIAWFVKADTQPEAKKRSIIVVMLLALLSSEVTFYYVDFPIRRAGMIPASAILLGIRLIGALVVIVASVAVAGFVRRMADRLNATTIDGAALAVVALIQVMYFYIDWSADPAVRFIHVAAVLIATVGVAALAKGGSASVLRLGPLTAMSVLVLVLLQFAYFYGDYHKGFQARGSGTSEGNVRLALESVIDLAGERPVPAIYLARIRNEFGGLGNLFAKFYLIKHNRQDLVDRTIEGDQYGGFEVDRVLHLPAGSVVIVNPGRRNDPIIDQLVAAGELKKDALLRTPDGTAMFWILERTRK